MASRAKKPRKHKFTVILEFIEDGADRMRIASPGIMAINSADALKQARQEAFDAVPKWARKRGMKPADFVAIAILHGHTVVNYIH